MNIRAICEGQFRLPLPVASAIGLFTPEGERVWAGPSWDPVYALADAARDDAAAGTVFTTQTGGHAATWIVLERRDGILTYARIAPGLVAGTITVVCSADASGDETRVTVRYDTTSLSPEGARFVQELQAGYDAFLDGWRRAILGALAKQRDLDGLE
jgi:hypothetical protein